MKKEKDFVVLNRKDVAFLAKSLEDKDWDIVEIPIVEKKKVKWQKK